MRNEKKRVAAIIASEVIWDCKTCYCDVLFIYGYNINGRDDTVWSCQHVAFLE